MKQKIKTQSVQTAVNCGDEYEEQAAIIIKKYTLAAAAATGSAPVSAIDILGSIAAQLIMIRDLAHLYYVNTDNLTQTALYSAMGSTIAKLGTNLEVSVLTGDDSNKSGVAVAGIYTAAVGEFYKIHFQNGGTLEDVNIDDFANYFEEEVQ